MADLVSERKPCRACGQTIESRSVRCIHCLKEVEPQKINRAGVGLRTKALTVGALFVTVLGGYGLYRELHPSPVNDPSAQATFTYSRSEIDKKFEKDKSDEEVGPSQSDYNQQKSNENIGEWTRAIEKNPKDANAYLERGWAFNDLQEYENAIYDLSHAIALKPKWADAYCKRAWVHNTLGHYQKAVNDADKAIKFDSKNSEAYEARACAYASLGNSSHARADSAKAENISLQLSR